MAEHILINSESVPAHVNGKPQPHRVTDSAPHDVTHQERFLKSKTAEKGSSATQSLHHLAGDGSFDTEAHFTTHPKELRGHLPEAKEK
jgi:hypothetical protein